MPSPAQPTGSSNPPGVLSIQQRDRRVGAAVGSGPPPPSATSALSPHPHSNSLPPPSGNPSSTTQPPAPAAQTPVQQVLFSPADRYGLLGLLHIIKTTDPDLSMLALGSDLTTLGLDLGATEYVPREPGWVHQLTRRLQEPLLDLHYAVVRLEGGDCAQHRTRVPPPFVLQRPAPAGRHEDWKL